MEANQVGATKEAAKVHPEEVEEEELHEDAAAAQVPRESDLEAGSVIGVSPHVVDLEFQ